MVEELKRWIKQTVTNMPVILIVRFHCETHSALSVLPCCITFRIVSLLQNYATQFAELVHPHLCAVWQNKFTGKRCSHVLNEVCSGLTVVLCSEPVVCDLQISAIRGLGRRGWAVNKAYASLSLHFEKKKIKIKNKRKILPNTNTKGYNFKKLSVLILDASRQSTRLVLKEACNWMLQLPLSQNGPLPLGDIPLALISVCDSHLFCVYHPKENYNFLCSVMNAFTVEEWMNECLLITLEIHIWVDHPLDVELVQIHNWKTKQSKQ
jgi:hypothetical protein